MFRFDPIDGPSAQQLAETELRKAEYHADDPGIIDRIIDWALEKVAYLLSGTPGGSAALVLMVVLAAIIVFALVKAGPVRGRARGSYGDESDPLRPLAARDHRRLAEQATAAGDWAEALREWLRAAIATIEDRGVLDPRPGRTGATIAREAGASLPTAAQPLRAATDAFDMVWFGGRRATVADATLGRAAADAVAAARPVVAAERSERFVVPS